MPPRLWQQEILDYLPDATSSGILIKGFVQNYEAAAKIILETKPCPPKFLNMYGVYILRSKKDGTLYVGYSAAVKERIRQHLNGSVVSTSDKRPLEIIYCELYSNKKDAIQREKFFKTGWGRNYIKESFKEYFKSLIQKFGRVLFL